mmetsp:Transcript_98931/g.300271  ORF Transcript_98931/g.300271 Transcript_98931/m.300271 type:complete len:208 (+) Transcript_98931:161-784(+)
MYAGRGRGRRRGRGRLDGGALRRLSTGVERQHRPHAEGELRVGRPRAVLRGRDVPLGAPRARCARAGAAASCAAPLGQVQGAEAGGTPLPGAAAGGGGLAGGGPELRLGGPGGCRGGPGAAHADAAVGPAGPQRAPLAARRGGRGHARQGTLLRQCGAGEHRLGILWTCAAPIREMPWPLPRGLSCRITSRMWHGREAGSPSTPHKV